MKRETFERIEFKGGKLNAIRGLILVDEKTQLLRGGWALNENAFPFPHGRCCCCCFKLVLLLIACGVIFGLFLLVLGFTFVNRILRPQLRLLFLALFCPGVGGSGDHGDGGRFGCLSQRLGYGPYGFLSKTKTVLNLFCDFWKKKKRFN